MFDCLIEYLLTLLNYVLTESSIDIRYSLGDVPQIAGVVKTQKTIRHGDIMEWGFLLVAEERVRGPDLCPQVPFQLDDLQTLRRRRVPKARVAPLLTQVEIDRIVLQIRNWTSKYVCQPVSNQTLIRSIHHLSINQSIKHEFLEWPKYLKPEQWRIQRGGAWGRPPFIGSHFF